jgi:hypothetical protein
VLQKEKEKNNGLNRLPISKQGPVNNLSKKWLLVYAHIKGVCLHWTYIQKHTSIIGCYTCLLNWHIACTCACEESSSPKLTPTLSTPLNYLCF